MNAEISKTIKARQLVWSLKILGAFGNDKVYLATTFLKIFIQCKLKLILIINTYLNSNNLTNRNTFKKLWINKLVSEKKPCMVSSTAIIC